MTILIAVACLILGGWAGIALERFHAPILAFRERLWRASLYAETTEAMCAFIRGDRDP